MVWPLSVSRDRPVARELSYRIRENLAPRLTFGALSRAVVGQVALWRRRAIDRAELGRATRVELRDIRMSPGEAWDEARKPFWRGWGSG